MAWNGPAALITSRAPETTSRSEDALRASQGTKPARIEAAKARPLVASRPAMITCVSDLASCSAIKLPNVPYPPKMTTLGLVIRGARTSILLPQGFTPGALANSPRAGLFREWYRFLE